MSPHRATRARRTFRTSSGLHRVCCAVAPKHRKSLATVAVLVAACHPRGPAEPEKFPDPVPMCAAERVIRERIEGSTLVVEVIQTGTCTPSAPAGSTELARVALEVNPSCPAGKALLEVGGGERVLLPELAARLDRRTMSELASALTEFSATNGNSYGRAFVVNCTDPKWLLVADRNGDPRAQLFSVPPPDAAPEPAPAGPLEDTLPRDALVTGTCTEPLDVGASVWVGRALSTGLLPGPSSLTTWTLGRTGDVAALVIQEFRATKKPGPPEDEQPQGTWACVRSTAWKGSVRGSPLKFTLSQGANGQQLALSCAKRTVVIADAAARRVRVPSSVEGCNASRWVPAAKRQLQFLACVTEGDGPEPTPFFVAERPGVEHVTYDNDDCGNGATALRRIPPAGGVASAIKISEQPDAYVPANLRRPR